MAGVTTQGLGSGLDIKTIVSNLVTAEQTPTKNRLDTQEATVQAKLSTLGIVKSSISDFQTSVQALTSLATLQGKSVSVSDQSLFSATTNNGAQVGQHSVIVKKMASAQKMASAGFSNNAAQNIGTGTLHIAYGDSNKAAKDIVIGASQSSLTGIRDAVNAAGAGIVASIVDDGSVNGKHLVFSAESGASNSLSISGDLQSKLNMTEKQKGQDAEVIIDGIDIQRATNSISGVIPGVTLDVKGVSGKDSTGGYVASSLAVANDKTSIANAINSFVNNFNALKGVLTKVTQYDATKKTASILTGDSTMRSLSTQMQRVMGNIANGGVGGVRALADIGVTTARDGTLKLDTVKLDSVLSTNIEAFAGLFATTGTASDSSISYTKAGATTKVGSFPVTITQAATQGKYIGAVGTGALPSTSGDIVKLGNVTNDSITSSNDKALYGEASFVTGSGDSNTVPGSYAVHITQYATQASYAMHLDTTPVVLTQDSVDPADTSKRLLKLSVDGTESGDIIMPTGTSNTGADFALKLQDTINKDATLKAAGRSVTVSYDTGGNLVFKSATIGSSSSISINDVGTDLSALGLSKGNGDNGQDIDGTIGGVAATGAGNILTGNGDASGLQVKIAGNSAGVTKNSALGDDRGVLNFSTLTYKPLTETSPTNPGDHAVNISQVATQGSFVAANYPDNFPGSIAFNTSFTIDVDGTSAAINLAPQAINNSTKLAQVIQNAINGNTTLANAGKQVAVSFTNGHLQITSDAFGSQSKVAISNVTLGSDLGFGAGVATQGTDVQGTIDGKVANGTGKLLTNAKQGIFTSAALSVGSYDITTANDSFSIKVDGKESGLITLNARQGLTGPQLAQYLQQSINNDSNLLDWGKQVAVTFDNGKLNIASTSATGGSIQLLNVEGSSPGNENGLGLAEMAAPLASYGSAGIFEVKDSNNAFAINVDGVDSNAITLGNEAGLDGTELASKVQAAINADTNLSAAGKKVAVTFTDGKLQIASTTYGSASSVKLFNVAGRGIGLANMTSAQVGQDTDFQVEVNGSAMGGANFAVDSSASTFKLKVDGIQSGLISVKAPTDGVVNAQFAEDMQTQINNDSTLKAAGRSVQVGIDSESGKLTITSSAFGSISQVEINQISPVSAALGLVIKAGDAGADVQGSIGSAPAVGSGTQLTGTGDADGLQINVTGDAIGARGSLDFGKGIADQLNSVLLGFLGNDGAIAQKVTGLNTQTTSIAKQRTDLADHITKYQAQLLAKFNAMDLIVGQLRATSDALTGQLANLPFTANNSK